MTKIISGGQTGVDQAALRVAISRGIPHGGWCPPQRACDDGIIPEQFNLEETPTEYSDKAPDIPRSLRTEWNVRDSDGTLIILTGKSIETGSGIEWTFKATGLFKKPCLVINIPDKQAQMKVREWLRKHRIHILNIAGPSEKDHPGIGEVAFGVILDLTAGA